MEEIHRFVSLVQTDRFTLTDLCEQFGISRKTGYKHLARYAEGGLKALLPRSHRPHTSPQRTDAAIEALILAERKTERVRPKQLCLTVPFGRRRLCRMPRKLRLEFPGACYHVINRGNYRADVFASDGAKAAFETCLREACGKSGWVLHAFVI